MTKFEQLIEDALSYEEAMKAPRRPLSAKAKAAILAGVDEVFGTPKVLSEAAMRLAILKILNEEGTATGSEMVERLKVLRWEMEPKGEGAILGLLYQMSNRGLIFASFDENSATRRYKIENAGSALLQKDEITVLGGFGSIFERQRMKRWQKTLFQRPIRFQFLERAQLVCDLAKVDHWEHTQVLSELREQMENSYRVYDQAGLYKDDAAAKALEDFGSPELIAKVYRDGFRGYGIDYFTSNATHSIVCSAPSFFPCFTLGFDQKVPWNLSWSPRRSASGAFSSSARITTLGSSCWSLSWPPTLFRNGRES